MSKKYNRKMGQYQKELPVPRVYYRKPRDKKSAAHLLIKCGDCNSQLEINYDLKKKEREIYDIEINGVLASIKEWRKILFPLLK
jgi:hypothetical protein